MEENAIDVAVGVLRRAGRVLIAKRPLGKAQGGLWEFPGGKIKPGEEAECALRRELEEELGICIGLSRHFMDVWYDYREYSVLLKVFVCADFEGDPVGMEGQPVLWVDEKRLGAHEFPDANVSIIAALRSVSV